MNLYFAAKQYLSRFFPFFNEPDEPVIRRNLASKRIHDENVNEDRSNKRRKLSPNSDSGIQSIDLTDSEETSSTASEAMPRHKRGKNKSNNAANIETIEILDDDDVEPKNETGSNSNDVESEDVLPTENVKNSFLSSPSDDVERSKGYNTRGSANAKSYLSLSSIQHSNSRLQRNKLESRTLRELNNRSSASCGLPSLTFKKSSALTRPTSPPAFQDKLFKSQLRKTADRGTFLNLLKQYACSPEAKNQRLSASASLASSHKKPTRIFGSAQSSRTFNTFNSKQSNLSLDSKQSNQDVDFTPTRGDSVLHSMCLRNRRSSGYTSSSTANTSAVNKTVIDLTSDEDDESQRQEIVSNVVSSDYIRNLKTSFVGKDKNIAEGDFISNILRKYEASMQSKATHVKKLQQQIRERRDDFHKTLAEILEQRLTLKEHEVEEEEPKPAFELAPITDVMRDAISQMIASRKVPLVQIKDTSVKVQDIRTLENCGWLNDEVINAYMNLIKMRAEKKPDKYPKVHCFNTFLYEQLQKKGYSSVRRWTKKIDIFDFNMLIIPIHLGNHWCLIQIKIKEKCIQYFDSMGSPNNHCLKSMLQYLVDEYKDKKNGDLDAGEWKLINMTPSEIPQQRNMYDCGVFACTFAEHLTRQAPFNFTQDNMPYFRVKMIYEILTAELLL